MLLQSINCPHWMLEPEDNNQVSVQLLENFNRYLLKVPDTPEIQFNIIQTLL